MLLLVVVQFERLLGIQSLLWHIFTGHSEGQLRVAIVRTEALSSLERVLSHFILVRQYLSWSLNLFHRVYLIGEFLSILFIRETVWEAFDHLIDKIRFDLFLVVAPLDKVVSRRVPIIIDRALGAMASQAAGQLLKTTRITPDIVGFHIEYRASFELNSAALWVTSSHNYLTLHVLARGQSIARILWWMLWSASLERYRLLD